MILTLPCLSQHPRTRFAATTILQVFVACTCLGISVNAQGLSRSITKDKISKPNRDTPRQSSEQLSGAKYSYRQAATLEMWQERDLSREDVQDAVHHRDPEVSARANWILSQWRRGSMPDTPPEIARLLAQRGDPAVLEELLELGQFSPVIVAVEELAGTSTRDAMTQRLAMLIGRRYPVYVQRAFEDNGLVDLLRLIDLVADSRELAACRLQLMQELGFEIDDEVLLPSSAKHWTGRLREQTLVTMLLILGRHEDALDQAERFSDPDLLRSVRMLTGQWRELATHAHAHARDEQADSLKQTRSWCDTLLGAYRCDDQSLVNEAIAALTSPLSTPDPQIINLRWKCLASHGYVEEAIAVLRTIDPQAASLIAASSSRTRLAFELLGYDETQIDSKLNQWIHQAIKKQESLSNSVTAQGTRNLSRLALVATQVKQILSLMQLMIDIGQIHDAWYIANRLCETNVVIGDSMLRDHVLEKLYLTSRRDWIVKLAVKEHEKSISSNAERMVVMSLSEMDSATWKLLAEAMAREYPSIPLSERLQTLYRLCEGEQDAIFDDDLLERVYDQIRRMTTPYGENENRQSNLFRQSNRKVLSRRVAGFFARLGRSALATACLEELKADGNLDAALSIAQSELNHGSPETASKSLDLIWEAVRTGKVPFDTDVSPSNLGIQQGYRQDPNAMTVAAKAFVGRYIVAQRLGHTEESEDLRRQIRLMLCGPSTQMQMKLLEHLNEEGETTLIQNRYRTLLCLTALGSIEGTELYDVARNYATQVRDSDPSEAAHWFDLAIGGTLESAYYRSVAYITLPIYVSRWSLEAAIKANDPIEANKYLDRIFKLNPLDIDVAERLLPKMKSAELAPIGKDAMQKIWQVGNEYVRDYPFDATACNNLAWVAAMNHHQLKQAAQLAEQAVYFEPDSAIYRDTLAELLFLLDRKEEALLIEKACLLDDPDQWHLHKQIKKYTKLIHNQ